MALQMISWTGGAKSSLVNDLEQRITWHWTNERRIMFDVWAISQSVSNLHDWLARTSESEYEQGYILWEIERYWKSEGVAVHRRAEELYDLSCELEALEDVLTAWNPDAIIYERYECALKVVKALHIEELDAMAGDALAYYELASKFAKWARMRTKALATKETYEAIAEQQLKALN